jgi:hypothetical protein
MLRNVPYDAFQPMIFQGEEMSIGIRGFTVGYDYYAPERSVCFHHYATGKNAAVRNKVKHFWENGDRYKGYVRSSREWFDARVKFVAGASLCVLSTKRN